MDRPAVGKYSAVRDPIRITPPILLRLAIVIEARGWQRANAHGECFAEVRRDNGDTLIYRTRARRVMMPHIGWKKECALGY
jgi:hypothetical protein